jgi:DNA ligase D-like protein (predicted polymerase)
MSAPDEDEVRLEVDGREVAVSSPDKVFFSERGETKRDLIEFYEAVRDPSSRRWVVGRSCCSASPRAPRAARSSRSGSPGARRRGSRRRWSRRRTAPRRTRWSSPTWPTSPWAVNKGCLGFHVWPARADDPAHADELRIDLDPTPGVTFPMVRDAARLVQEVLVEHGLTGWPKTTGNRGIHIYLRLEPRWDSYEVRSAAVALARELERRAPELVTAAWWKEERGERVFVDYNQNAPHKTVFGAWCVRARPGAQVSTPFSWDELDDDLHPDRFTIPVVVERVATLGDPWQGMYERPQSLEPLLALHERDVAAGLMDAPWPPVYPKQPNEPPRVAPSRAKKERGAGVPPDEV